MRKGLQKIDDDHSTLSEKLSPYLPMIAKIINIEKKTDVRDFFDASQKIFNLDETEVRAFNKAFKDLSIFEFPQLSFRMVGSRYEQAALIEAQYILFFVTQVKFFLILENGKKYLDELLAPKEEKVPDSIDNQNKEKSRSFV